MRKPQQTTPIDDLLARPTSARGRCIVCRTLPDEGLADVREFVAKRSAAGVVAGESRLLPYLVERYAAEFGLASLRRHMTRCCG